MVRNETGATGAIHGYSLENETSYREDRLGWSHTILPRLHTTSLNT